jgi:hypothetical protein
MSPDVILVVLLTIVAMRPFIELPDTWAKAEAQRKGGYKSSATRSCLYLLLMPIMLGLWWWYALLTDQLLLGVIPSVGLATSLVAVGIETAARKGKS